MNLIKRIVLIVIIFEMVFMVSLFPVSRAENENFTLTANKTTIDVDETIDVELNLSNGMQNQNQLTIIIKYDSAKLEIIPDTKDTDDSEILLENESLYNDIVMGGDGIILGFVNDDSTLSLVYYTNSAENYLKTGAKLAKLRFKAIKSGFAKISFDTIEYAYESNEPTQIIMNNDLTIKINGNIIKGDINGDGKVNGKDWNRLYEHINETKLLTKEEGERADVNNDGKVNGKDWNRLYEHINETNPLF